MEIVFVLLLLIFANLNASSCEGPHVGINDDYCDCSDGSDEPETSACSFIAKTSFICKGSGVLNATIPVSRVNDGVCDCCDGSDETNSQFRAVKCENKCAKSLLAERQNALEVYRKFQAGKSARTEVLSDLARRRSARKKSFSVMLHEKVQLTEIWMRMKFWLAREQTEESQWHFRLLRERASRCGFGEERACDYFHSGWLDEDRLSTEGYPTQYANPKKRLKLKPRDAHEQQRWEQMSGIEKVRWSGCNYSELMPDPTSRIFNTVGDYESFFLSTGGLASQKKTTEQIRRETLFARYLERGERGHLEGCCLLVELLGLALSPVILSFNGVSHLLFEWMLPKLSNGALGVLTTIASWRNSEKSSAIIKPISSVAAAMVNIIDEIGSYNSPSVSPPATTRDSRRTIVSDALDALDYTSYSWAMSIVDYFHPYLVVPRWIASVCLKAPGMYLDYYFYQRYRFLPPRRNNCLLRVGIDVAANELNAVSDKIDEYKLNNEGYLDDLTSAERENLDRMNSKAYSISLGKSYSMIMDAAAKYLGFMRNFKDKVPSRKKFGATKKKSSQENTSPPSDLGVDGEWEAVVNKCIEKDIQSYAYKFCFFGEVKQNQVNLGRFSGWGRLAAETETERTKGNRWTLSRTAEDPVTTSYDYQAYSGGSPCVSGSKSRSVKRRSEVHLVCGANDEIVDVSEPEVCLYRLTVSTPLACTAAQEEIILEKLGNLQVFGFSNRT